MDPALEAKVESALAKARTVLDIAKQPCLASQVPHTYGDKYLLAEAVGNTGVAATVVALEALGLSGPGLSKARAWTEGGRSVTLRVRGEERCEFAREEKREEESATKHVRDYGVGSITDKVVTTITEYFWSFAWTYELFLFAGNDETDKVVLQGRTGRCEIVTTGNKEASPKPKVVIRDPQDVNVTWLLQQLSGDGRVTGFAIARDEKQCRTPRRNRQTEAALEFFERFERWCESVDGYVRRVVFPVETKHGLALESINANAVFVPVLPIFMKKRGNAGDEQQQQQQRGDGLAIVPSSEAVQKSAVAVSASDLNAFLDEQKRSLAEKVGEVAKAFPSNGKLITAAEAALAVTLQHGARIAQYVAAGLEFIEDMLRKQVVAAIGKELTASDFAEYMLYHNRKVFKSEYQPKAFCYAIRRPGYYPEGILSIEARVADGGGSGNVMAQPVQTIVSESELLNPMEFSIAAAAKVRFGGRVFVHGLMMHEFEESSGLKLTLNARARQFSCFLVLVGRIAGPGLFDPQFGMIVQNKDEITIPLDIETIPSAGEFKAATVSISPEQQAFAKMYRGMQLASTLFGVCVVQIKPQMERVLKLTNEALTKEIKLTQDLLSLFIEYQIPSDLLSWGGSEGADRDVRLAGVRRNVRSVLLTIEWEKIKEKELAMQEAEARALEAVQNGSIIIRHAVGRLGRARGEEREEEVFLSGGRGGANKKKSEAKKEIEAVAEPEQNEIEVQLDLEPEPVEAKEKDMAAERLMEIIDLPQQEDKKQEEEREMRKEEAPERSREKSKKKMAPSKDMKRKVHASMKEDRSEKKKEYIDHEEIERQRQLREVERVRREFAAQKEELEKRRKEIIAERTQLDELSVKANESLAGPLIRVAGQPQVALSAVDYTKIPSALDEALERLDTDGALRPSIINVGKVWSKRSQQGLLGNAHTKSLEVAEQKLEKNTCYDLLDALTRSGGLGVEDATLHIVVSTTHCFGRNLMDTLVKDNVNPIEKVEHTQLIVASQVFGGKTAAELLRPSEIERVKKNSPSLF